MAGATYSAHLFYSDSVSLVGVKGTECASSFESACAEIAREDTLNDIRVAKSRRRGIGVPDTTNKILIERHADLGRCHVLKIPRSDAVVERPRRTLLVAASRLAGGLALT